MSRAEKLFRPQGLSRRGFMRKTAATAAAGGVLTGGSTQMGHSPVGRADAIPPIVIGGLAAGTALAIDWVLREQVYDHSEPPEGLTGDALNQEVYQAARTRKSDNGSTIVDNENILEGASNTGYVEGKLAAIEALNEGETQENVETAATEAVNEYATTLEKNLLSSWNESVRELDSYCSSILDHEDLSIDSVISPPSTGDWPTGSNRSEDGTHDVFGEVEVHELPNGEEMDLERLNVDYQIYVSTTDPYTESANINWTPMDNGRSHDDDGDFGMSVNYDGNSVDHMQAFLEYGEGEVRFASMYPKMQSVFDDVRNGILLWVDEVYGQVQSGDISIEDLMTPRERAEMMSEDEEFPNAIADLLALNMDVDFEREATIRLLEAEMTLRGTFAMTDANTIETGTVYDPDTMDGDVMFTYDITTGTGDWGAYEDGIDGGIVTFTNEPHEAVEYHIDTAAGETAIVPASYFDGDGDGNWEADLSGQLDTNITEVEDVEYIAESDETQFETIRLEQEFEVERIENSDGEKEQTAEFTSSEPQEDDNYITQEEWDELQSQNEDLIEKWEEAYQQSGGAAGPGEGGFWGSFAIDLPGGGQIPGHATAAGVGVGAAYAGAKAGIFGASEAASVYLPGK